MSVRKFGAVPAGFSCLIVLGILVLPASGALAHDYCSLPSAKTPGCQWLPGHIRLAALADPEQAKQMHLLYKVICQFPQIPGAQVLYPGAKTLATYAWGRKGTVLYYPNGRVATYSAGTPGVLWYYPNGKPISHSVGTPGAALLYPSGRPATYSAGRQGAAWMYPNGRVITYAAGSRAIAWYYPNGRPITYAMGLGGVLWHDFRGGVLFRSGPALSDHQLLDPPSLLCQYR